MISSTSILSSALNLFEAQLEIFATSPEFQLSMMVAFGRSHDYTVLQQIFLQKKTNILPLIEVVSLASLNGAYGAFSRDTNKIHLALEFIDSTTPTAIADVLLEEYGHYVDAQLNSVETIGDEGEIFADLVQGNLINPTAFTEDDTNRINVDGNWITVEQAAGDLDPSFGGGSGLFRFTVNGVTNATVSGVKVQPDGNIVVAGGTDFPANDRGDFVLMRINSDGTNYDPSFGNGVGIVATFVDNPNTFGREFAVPGGLALQPDGKIIVAGSIDFIFETTNADEISDDMYLIRYNSDGSLDSSFSFDGLVRTNLGGIDIVRSVLLQPDGKILVVGGITVPLPGLERERRIFVTRYNSNGSLDITFDNDGIVFTPVFELINFEIGAETNVSMALQPDGKVLIGFTVFGNDLFDDSQADFVLFRYNSDGSIDNTFGSTGSGSLLLNVSALVDQRTGSFDSIEALSLQPNGKIIAAGTSGNDASNLDLTLVRINSNGSSLDTSFGVNGVAITDLGSNVVYSGVQDVKLQANGRIVVATILNNGSFVLTRHNNDGTLDTSFGSSGVAPIPVLPSFDEPLALQENGNILVAGTSGNDTYAVARFLGDPVPIFNAAQYGASYADLISFIGYNLDLLTQHYQFAGRFEGRQTDLFDEYRYLASNPDLIPIFGLNGAIATEHYIRAGFFEGRSTTAFDPARYLNSYSDLLTVFGTNTWAATQHYITNGFWEGRNPNLFSSDRYLASYGDLIQVFGYNLEAGSNHYLLAGKGEGRQVLFDPQAYLNRYSDLQAAFGNDLTAATQHYITNGFSEGRTWM